MTWLVPAPVPKHDLNFLTVPLNIDADTRPRIPRRESRPDYAKNLNPPIKEGVGNAGCPLHPQPRVEE